MSATDPSTGTILESIEQNHALAMRIKNERSACVAMLKGIELSLRTSFPDSAKAIREFLAEIGEKT